jgi:dihydroorotate dehydrogenase
MIELAPNRKQGLALANPLIAASGAIGFGGEAADLVALERFGALVTAPISLRPRRGSAPPRLAPTPGGMLLQTGGQSPGWRRVAEQHGGAWARSRAPIIAHISGHTSLGELARRAEATRGIAGLELDLDGAESLPLLAALRRASELPILVRLPYHGAGLAARAVEAGADALVCIMPPRGTTVLTGGHSASSAAHGRAEDGGSSAGGQLVEGSLFGPLVRALALQTLRETVDALAVVVGETGEFGESRRTPSPSAGANAAPREARAEGNVSGLPSMQDGSAAVPARTAQSAPLWGAAVRMRGGPAVPLIACGGVHSAEDVMALLAAGASAVMVDSLAWVAPHALNALLARDYGQSK